MCKYPNIRVSDKRLPDWQSRLFSYITKCANKKFEYGVFDCVIFSTGAVGAITGVNPHELYPPVVYSNAEESKKVLIECYGVENVEQLWDKILGLENRINPNLAQRGDIVVKEIEGSLTAGVCAGLGFAFAGKNKITRLTTCKTAWKVGR